VRRDTEHSPSRSAGEHKDPAIEPDVPPAIRDDRARIEAVLERCLAPATTHPARFHAAIRYAVLGGGKRLRPLLAYATGRWLGVPVDRVDAIAVAIELVHAYSVAHDDLPAMNDDDLRSGRATTHRAFDEATAILVGDALQTLAYEVLANDSQHAAAPEIQLRLIRDLAEASGSAGMAGGQALDMAATGTQRTVAETEDLCGRKTGRLLHAAVLMPCRLRPDLDPMLFAGVDKFGHMLGLAFQLADDLLDGENSTVVIGKSQGSDRRNQRATFAGLLGSEGAQRRLVDVHRAACAALDTLGPGTESLRWICDWVVRRDR
jgi:farnesyl diphosphate synthase